jgi:hypothetical protein
MCRFFENKNSVLDEHLTFIFGIQNETLRFSELYTPVYFHGITSWNTIIFLFLNVRNIYNEPKYYFYTMNFVTRCRMNTRKRGIILILLFLPWTDHSLHVQVLAYVSLCFRNLYFYICVQEFPWRVWSWLLFCSLYILLCLAIS